MERWIIHYDAHYDAVPWPYPVSWEQFVQSPQALEHPCDDFGRAAPCDGLSETPSVPPHLPRLQPRGRYRMAIYHDSHWLYAFLDAQNGPAIVTPEDLRAIPHLRDVHHVYPVLALLTADERFTCTFGLDGRGQPRAAMQPVAYGSRKPSPPSWEPEFALHVIPTEGGDLSCWRIARAGIAAAFQGDLLRVSISRMHLPSIEAVAWGSHTTWGPRPDEFGTVRLVAGRTTPSWPIARRIELLYEPATESGRFVVQWEGRYEASEAEVQVYPDKTQIVPWRQFALRLNGEQHLYDMAEEAQTAAAPLVDGHNDIVVATPGGPAVRMTLEKRSGNRIAAPSGPAIAAYGRDWLVERVRRECEQAIAVSLDASGTGQRVYRGWETYHAASLGRVYHYLDPNPRLLEALRVEADYAMGLQREDGSFEGFHMARLGRKPTPWAGGAYDSGPAGELWCVAARLLGDPKYLQASQRLLHAYKDYRVEFNYNFAAFALYHLVTHYRLTRDPLALEHALHYCRHCVAVDLMPLGFHAGHNYYTCYGSITLRGMAQLCAVLPGDDPYRATLREQCIRMANQVLARQQPDGSFDGFNRFFLGQRFWSWGLFSVAFLLPPDDVARLDAAIQRLLHYRDVSTSPAGTFDRLAESDLVRYYAHREGLLRGEKIDLMELI